MAKVAKRRGRYVLDYYDNKGSCGHYDLFSFYKYKDYYGADCPENSAAGTRKDKKKY